jgi:hypothetical protein
LIINLPRAIQEPTTILPPKPYPTAVSMSTGFLPSFIAAIQASLSVLLVLLSGGIAAHLKLIGRADTKSIVI